MVGGRGRRGRGRIASCQRWVLWVCEFWRRQFALLMCTPRIRPFTPPLIAHAAKQQVRAMCSEKHCTHTCLHILSHSLWHAPDEQLAMPLLLLLLRTLLLSHGPGPLHQWPSQLFHLTKHQLHGQAVTGGYKQLEAVTHGCQMDLSHSTSGLLSPSISPNTSCCKAESAGSGRFCKRLQAVTHAMAALGQRNEPDPPHPPAPPNSQTL